ncbi:hypothetical protein [Streptomyces sp. NPDC058667]|uniref:hypothetical protein n=1 Tax=Streptomyces sp. NPDC058667 TaxID=3346588 RepID=UPI0036695DFB
MTDSDFTCHLGKVADWYRAVLTELYPAGPDRDAKVLLFGRDDKSGLAQDLAPAVGAAVVQWARVVLVLPDAEGDAGRAGWQPSGLR